MDAHLVRCRSCRDAALEIEDVNRHLAVALLPALIGAGAALVWLAGPAPQAVVAGAVSAAAGTASAHATGISGTVGLSAGVAAPVALTVPAGVGIGALALVGALGGAIVASGGGAESSSIVLEDVQEPAVVQLDTDPTLDSAVTGVDRWYGADVSGPRSSVSERHTETLPDPSAVPTPASLDLTAWVDELRAYDVGEHLETSVTSALDGVAETADAVLESPAVIAEDVVEVVDETVDRALGTVRDLATRVVDGLSTLEPVDDALTPVRPVVDEVLDTADDIVGVIGPATGEAVDLLDEVGGSLSDVANSTLDIPKNLFKPAS